MASFNVSPQCSLGMILPGCRDGLKSDGAHIIYDLGTSSVVSITISLDLVRAQRKKLGVFLTFCAIM